jgi:hypothetical protein
VSFVFNHQGCSIRRDDIVKQWLVGSIGACLITVLTACGSTANPSGAPTTGPVALPTLIFDYLGGNSPYILVYPGSSDSQTDRKSSGGFNNGDTVQVICRTTGRMVRSVYPERPRQSDVWYKVALGGQEYYATKVYTSDVQGSIPSC